jgi:AAA family ATP:ADP antiporter
VVFRGGDAVSSWLFALLRATGLELSTIAAATLPVTGAWLVLALWLGRAQERAARLGQRTEARR